MVHSSAILALTDEEGLLFEDFAQFDPQRVRTLLAALNLQISGHGEVRADEVFELAVYRATGDRHLATLFGTAR